MPDLCCRCSSRPRPSSAGKSSQTLLMIAKPNVTAFINEPAGQASFGNGRIEEFLLDQNLDAAMVRSPKIAAITGTFCLSQLLGRRVLCCASAIADQQLHWRI